MIRRLQLWTGWLRTTPLFTFDTKEFEAEFAAHFGIRCSIPSFLLSTVMALIWTTRLISLQTRVVSFNAPLSCTFAGMAALHSFNAVAILRNAAVCCSESRKAKLLLLDAMVCMITVITYVGRQEDIKSSALLSSPFVLYAIHGWSIPFAGFRFVADLFLHSLCLQIYVILQLQQASMHAGLTNYWIIPRRAVLAFCACSLIPLLVNLCYEANVRLSYLNMRRVSPRRLGRFWLTILMFSSTNTQA